MRKIFLVLFFSCVLLMSPISAGLSIKNSPIKLKNQNFDFKSLPNPSDNVAYVGHISIIDGKVKIVEAYNQTLNLNSWDKFTMKMTWEWVETRDSHRWYYPTFVMMWGFEYGEAEDYTYYADMALPTQKANKEGEIFLTYRMGINMMAKNYTLAIYPRGLVIDREDAITDFGMANSNLTLIVPKSRMKSINLERIFSMLHPNRILKRFNDLGIRNKKINQFQLTDVVIK